MTKLIKNFIAKKATIKATTLPTIKGIILSCKICNQFSEVTNFNSLYAVAANIVGTARKKENSAAFFRVIFCAIPPTIVAIERETPGIIAMHWNRPIQTAFLGVIS